MDNQLAQRTIDVLNSSAWAGRTNWTIGGIDADYQPSLVSSPPVESDSLGALIIPLDLAISFAEITAGSLALYSELNVDQAAAVFNRIEYRGRNDWTVGGGACQKVISPDSMGIQRIEYRDFDAIAIAEKIERIEHVKQTKRLRSEAGKD